MTKTKNVQKKFNLDDPSSKPAKLKNIRSLFAKSKMYVEISVVKGTLPLFTMCNPRIGPRNPKGTKEFLCIFKLKLNGINDFMYVDYYAYFPQIYYHDLFSLIYPSHLSNRYETLTVNELINWSRIPGYNNLKKLK